MVAVLAVLLAIYWLTQAQMPGESGLEALDTAANDANSELSRAVAADRSFTRGRKDIATFLVDLRAARKRFYSRKADLAAAEQRVLKAKEPRALRAAEGERDRARIALALAEANLDDLRRGSGALTELSVYLAIRDSFRAKLPRVLWASVVAAGSFILFAWAANPPDVPSSSTVLEPRPTLAQLALSAQAAAALEKELGGACADRAVKTTDVRIIALTSAKGKVTAVVIPDGICKRPVRITVDATAVIPADEVPLHAR